VRGGGDKGSGRAWRHVMTSVLILTVTPAPHSGKCRDRDEVIPYLTHGTGVLEHRSSRDVGCQLTEGDGP
jgi:hypothetical protein